MNLVAKHQRLTGDDPIQIGIIGGGFMGRRHVESMSALRQFVLAGVADPYSTSLADDYRARAFTDHRDLLQSGIDAVIIANPNDAHVATALDAHAAGVPALVEKPLATNLSALRPLIDAASSGSPLLVGHHRRHHPAIAPARALIDAGAIGRPVAVNGMWITRKADTYFDAAWRRELGGGVVLINAVHDLDLLRVLCGEISAVHATFSSSTRGFPVPDTASVNIEFANGALGTYICSDAAVSPWTWDQATHDEPAFPFNRDASCYFISGTEGSLTFPQLVRHRYDGKGDWNEPLSADYLVVAPGDSYTRQLLHFADVVRGAALPMVSVLDAARTIALLDAVERSSVTGERVSVEARYLAE